MGTQEFITGVFSCAAVLLFPGFHIESLDASAIQRMPAVDTSSIHTESVGVRAVGAKAAPIEKVLGPFTSRTHEPILLFGRCWPNVSGDMEGA